jgi:hypothetical protein
MAPSSPVPARRGEPAALIWVLGKHSRGRRREEAYGMFGAVSAFKAMRAARPDD